MPWHLGWKQLRRTPNNRVRHLLPGSRFMASPFGSPNVESENLAGLIQEALVARTRSDRGTKPDNFL